VRYRVNHFSPFCAGISCNVQATRRPRFAALGRTAETIPDFILRFGCEPGSRLLVDVFTAAFRRVLRLILALKLGLQFPGSQ
jgi:hypothetical protein